MQKYRDRNGRVSQYFSKVSGRGADVDLLSEDTLLLLRSVTRSLPGLSAM